MCNLTISDLVIYPIKALPGVHVKQGVVHAQGLQHASLKGVRDRAFMVVDGTTGKFLSLRTHAVAFSKISLSLNEEAGTLELAAPGVDVFRVDVSEASDTKVEEMRSKVWEWEGQASVIDRDWFSKVVGQDVALVRCRKDMNRPVDPEYATQGPQKTGFSDGFPYLFAFEESLIDLFEDTYGPAARTMMPRFRGNIIVSGGRPWQEDEIRRLTCSEAGVSFDLCKPCSRCTVPTVDPATGAVDKRISDLLRSRRSGGVLGWVDSTKHSTFFGVNACVIRESMSVQDQDTDGEYMDGCVDDDDREADKLIRVGQQLRVR